MNGTGRFPGLDSGRGDPAGAAGQLGGVLEQPSGQPSAGQGLHERDRLLLGRLGGADGRGHRSIGDQEGQGAEVGASGAVASRTPEPRLVRRVRVAVRLRRLERLLVGPRVTAVFGSWWLVMTARETINGAQRRSHGCMCLFYFGIVSEGGRKMMHRFFVCVSSTMHGNG